MGGEDAADEVEGVRVDCAAEAEGWVDPGGVSWGLCEGGAWGKGVHCGIIVGLLAFSGWSCGIGCIGKIAWCFLELSGVAVLDVLVSWSMLMRLRLWGFYRVPWLTRRYRHSLPTPHDG